MRKLENVALSKAASSLLHNASPIYPKEAMVFYLFSIVYDRYPKTDTDTDADAKNSPMPIPVPILKFRISP